MANDPAETLSIHPSVPGLVAAALEEDCAADDITTALLGETGLQVTTGRFLAQGDFVLAGGPVIAEVFGQLGDARTELLVDDGKTVECGRVFAQVHGPARVLLAGERTALNFVQHLSGIATAARLAVEAVAGTDALVADTRKTTPGLRHLEKYAVRKGGATNHRSDLAEAVFFKDNHWEMMRRAGRDLAGLLVSVPEGVKVVVEVDDLDQFKEALAAGAGHVMVDNQPPGIIREWKAQATAHVVIEASGGITLENIRDYALAGADVISLGALTHSVAAAPIGFEVGWPGPGG